MGISTFARSSDCNTYKTVPGNPNPSQFYIERIAQYGNNTVAMLQYDGCTNYEGNKIIVWRGMTAYQVNNLPSIDPHFTEDNNIVARFVPTEEGWEMASKFASSLDDR